MRRSVIAPFALLLAPLAFSTASATAAAPGTMNRAAIVDTEIVPASARAPLVIAKEALARALPFTTALELAHVDTVTLADGQRVVSFAQTIDGIPVLQRGARVVVEADGRATLATQALEERRPVTTKATLSPATALSVAAARGVPANALGARLMIVAGEEPRLVYGVIGDFGALPTRPVVLLDAQTGEVVQQWDAAISLQQAKVYGDNPIKTPTTTLVTLANDTTKEGLQNALVTAVNCIDQKTVRTINVGIPLQVHTCDLLHTIVPDANGDYLDVLPESGGQDKYAELSMFHHTDRVYEFVKALGFPAEKVTRLTAIANLRVPQGFSTFNTTQMADPNLPLVAFDNAFFAQQDPLLSTAFGLQGDAMWFGQGTRADFGYDGDVVYHEFGHFLVSRTIKLGGGAFADEFGLSMSPGGLNESLADILSFFVTGDPELGEYTTTGIGGAAGKGMRSATNTFKFPDAITGQVHQDSEPFSAGVWKAYAALDATKKKAFQKATLQMLLTAPTGDAGYGDVAELLVKSVTSGVDAATGSALRTAFDERGIKKGDPRVRPFADKIVSVKAVLGIHAPGKSDTTKKGDYAPGLFQIKYDAPAGGLGKLHVVANNIVRGGTFGTAGGALGGNQGTPFAPVLLVKASADPIKFTYGPTTAEGTTVVPCAISGDKKTFACDADVELPGTWGTTTPVHLMIANKGDQGADYDAVVVTAEPPPEPITPAADPVPVTETTTSGCGCTIPGGASHGTATLALAALGLFLARRRR